MGKTCVITLGIATQQPAGHAPIVRDFSAAIDRLADSLKRHGFDGEFVSWRNEYPQGSPSHDQSPFAFKAHCFNAVVDRGYDAVLWLDATVEVKQPIEAIFQAIDYNGYAFFEEQHSVGEYCKDDALVPLGISREESFQLPSCWACAIGLKPGHAKAREFLRRWTALADDGVTFPGPRWSGRRGFPVSGSTDPRVHGHRHDQTAASVVAHRLEMTRWFSKQRFFHFFSNNRIAVPTLGNGAELPAAGQRHPRTRNSKTIRVLFFSRGRGRGHAIPDAAIADELLGLRTDLDIQFASYATGADALRSLHWPVIDLRLSESNRIIRTIPLAHAIVEATKPDVVIAHEEPAALVAAHLAQKPSVFITDWYPSPTDQSAADCLTFADATIFLGPEGLFPPPMGLRSVPICVGPVVQRMRYSLKDRSRCRAKMNLPDDARVISVIPGAWATEARVPIAQLVIAAFHQLPPQTTALVWLSRADHSLIKEQAARAKNIHVFDEVEAVEQVIVASDMVITKGNRGTIFDAASLGVPSISLSPRLNPVDDIISAQVHSNRTLNLAAVDASFLRSVLTEVLTSKRLRKPKPLNLHKRGGADAAIAISGEIDRLLKH